MMRNILSPPVIVCDVPPIENGVFFPFREAATVGSSVDFVCDEGYTLSGPSSRTCQVNGQYDGVGANCSSKGDIYR